MATDDQGNDGPSLELPSLGFGRRKRRGRSAEPPTDAPASTDEITDEVTDEPASPPEPAPATTPQHTLAPLPEPTPAPHADPEPRPGPPPEPQPQPVRAPQPTVLEPAPDRATGDGERPHRSGPSRRSLPGRRSLPALPGVGTMTAAVLTGAIVGLAIVGLTWGALRGCEATRGTATCGGGPGFLLLVVIVVLAVLLGGALLRALHVNDPGSTSFLGVALLTVVALLFLIDVLASGWMIVVVPVVGAAMFALAHWVTTAFVEPAGR